MAISANNKKIPVKSSLSKNNSKTPAVKRNKLIWIGIPATLLVIASVTGSVYWLTRPSLKDAPKKTEPKQVAAYLASDKFNQLSMEDKKTYVSQISDGQPPWQIMRQSAELPKADREKLHSNMEPVMHAVMKERLNNFFKMSKEDQQKELEKMMAQRNQYRGQGGQRPAQPAGGTAVAANSNPGQPPAGGGGGRGGGRSPVQRKARFETVDSNTRAQGVEFRKLMMQQRQQQGR
jgi:hypothetical protein